MANYLYNGVELPEMPSITDGKQCFIYEKNGEYRIRWWPSDATIYAKSTKRINVTFTSKDRSYGICLAQDGAWILYNPADMGSKNWLEFTNVLNVIWSNVDIPYPDGSLYFTASDPVPVPESMSDLEPLSLLQGWIMGRKTARSRQSH